MSSKKDTFKQRPKTKRISIKWVRRAGSWCRTSWKGDEQKQQRFKDKPDDSLHNKNMKVLS